MGWLEGQDMRIIRTCNEAAETMGALSKRPMHCPRSSQAANDTNRPFLDQSIDKR